MPRQSRRPIKHRSARLRKYKEYAILILIVVGFVLLVFEMLGKLSATGLRYFEWFEYFTAAVFLADFIYELRLSHDRAHYMKHNWFYLIAAIPLPYAAVDILRSIRLIRVIKLLRVGAHFEYEQTTKMK